MNTPINDADQIRITIDDAKETVAAGAALERLRNNADFQRVIGTMYLRDEAIRLTHLKGDYSQRDDESQKVIERDMFGISSLANFLDNLARNARIMQQSIEEYESELDLAEQEIDAANDDAASGAGAVSNVHSINQAS